MAFLRFEWVFDICCLRCPGHETTGSVLTWTVYLLAQNPEKLKLAQEEVDRVLKNKQGPSFSDTRELKYVTRCINESMRLYPHPPVLIRRAKKEDTLPGGYTVGPGQDIMISVYNIHHSPQVRSAVGAPCLRPSTSTGAISRGNACPCGGAVWCKQKKILTALSTFSELCSAAVSRRESVLHCLVTRCLWCTRYGRTQRPSSPSALTWRAPSRRK